MSILIFLVVSAYTLLIYIVNASYERIGVRDQVFRAVKENNGCTKLQREVPEYARY